MAFMAMSPHGPNSPDSRICKCPYSADVSQIFFPINYHFFIYFEQHSQNLKEK